MSRSIFGVLSGALVLVGFIFVARQPAVQGQVKSQPSTTSDDWPLMTADLKGSKYSPLDEITAEDFGKLEVAWYFKADSLGPRQKASWEARRSP